MSRRTTLKLPPHIKPWIYDILDPIREIPAGNSEFAPIDVYMQYSGRFVSIGLNEILTSRYDIKHDPRGFKYVGGSFVLNHIHDDGSCTSIEYSTSNPDGYPGLHNGANIHQCANCSNWFDTESFVSQHGTCKNCVDFIRSISPKSNPGWNELKKGDTGPWFGLELEFIDKNNDPIKLANAANKASGLMFPGFITTDVSIGNSGRELNTVPMSLDWYIENRDKFQSFLKYISDNGGTHLGYDGNERCGLHIHISASTCDKNFASMVNDYSNHYREIFIDFSGRSIASYNKWCNGNYHLFAQRSSGETFEYRGFSAKKWLDNPNNILYCMQWVDALAKASRNPCLFLKRPSELVEVFGYSELSSILLNIERQYQFRIERIPDTCEDITRIFADKYVRMANAGIPAKIAEWKRTWFSKYIYFQIDGELIAINSDCGEYDHRDTTNVNFIDSIDSFTFATDSTDQIKIHQITGVLNRQGECIEGFQPAPRMITRDSPEMLKILKQYGFTNE